MKTGLGFRFILAVSLVIISSFNSFAQQKGVNVGSLFELLPSNFHAYKTTHDLDGKPFIAYYAEAKMQDRNLVFSADTTKDRRITP